MNHDERIAWASSIAVGPPPRSERSINGSLSDAGPLDTAESLVSRPRSGDRGGTRGRDSAPDGDHERPLHIFDIETAQTWG
jgi:hypothetical protein